MLHCTKAKPVESKAWICCYCCCFYCVVVVVVVVAVTFLQLLIKRLLLIGRISQMPQPNQYHQDSQKPLKLF